MNKRSTPASHPEKSYGKSKKRKPRKTASAASEQRRYAWRGALTDLRRTPLTTFLTVMVIAVSLTLPSLCFIIYKNISHAASEYYPAPQITAYLDKALSDDAAQKVAEEIRQQAGIGKVDYLSRQQALNEFRGWSGFSSALDMLENNPLPAVVIATPKISLHSDATLTSLRDRISHIKGVDEVRMDDSWFNRLSALTHLAGQLAGLIGVLMVAAVFLVIGNSVRLTIFARRATINVQKLIGATDGFILRPFLYGGAIQGFAGACFALIFTELLILRLSTAVSQLAGVFATKFQITGLAPEECLLILLTCTMIGWLAAWLATMQHLRHYVAE